MNGILTQEHLDKGLTTVIHFDYIYLLDPKGYPICSFLGYGEAEEIRRKADLYIQNIDK